jgi:hypothetical protein
MFPDLETEVNHRFDMMERHLKMVPRKPVDLIRGAKGMAFVEIYGAYEYTVREATLAGFLTIAAHGHKYSDLKPSLMAMFLDRKLQPFLTPSRNNHWNARIELFEQCCSADPISTVDIVPNDGTHYRHTYVQNIFKVMGIKKNFVRLPRHWNMINEIVENRHLIAHGDESPLQVGSRFTRAEILHRMELMHTICIRIVRLIAEHSNDPAKHCRH